MDNGQRTEKTGFQLLVTAKAISYIAYTHNIIHIRIYTYIYIKCIYRYRGHCTVYCVCLLHDSVCYSTGTLLSLPL